MCTAPYIVWPQLENGLEKDDCESNFRIKVGPYHFNVLSPVFVFYYCGANSVMETHTCTTSFVANKAKPVVVPHKSLMNEKQLIQKICKNLKTAQQCHAFKSAFKHNVITN